MSLNLVKYRKTGFSLPDISLNFLIPVLLFLPLLLSCTRTVYEYERPEQTSTGSGYYGSSFPTSNISNEIEEIFTAVNRVQTTGYFYTYILDSSDFFVQDDLRGGNIRDLAMETDYSNQSKSATAVVISSRRSQSALLTANHAISFPDTIWHFIKSPDLEPETYVEAVTVLDRQTNLIIGNRIVSEFEIIARDESRDVALLSTRRENGTSTSLVSLQIEPGDSNRLDWANMVYLLGYPKGNKMVTTGVISPTGSSQQNQGFMIDTVFNPGFSGGLILAIREETGNFEWLGITTSTLADFDTFLTPEDSYKQDFDPDIPYTGDTFIQREPRINYGLTRTLSINEIRDFLNTNRSPIEQSGVDLSGY